ncbi:hypothetical protein KBI5_08915 [Frankia sp. KB5]|nr:hypothetical protein KBI5_08915 [Frankia sp. KB5]
MKVTLDLIDLAEEEIDSACARHPKHRDTLFHSFSLLRPTLPRMTSAFVYRAHCQELLGRVARVEDTRPGTAAEVCCLCADISTQVPLNSPAAGLYFRMWAQAFPHTPADDDRRAHHEALYASRIDDYEALARAKLAVDDRRLGTITCTGRHNTVKVPCRYTQF